MRKALRNFLAWLDKRFPERVVITQAAYDELLARIKAVEDAAGKVTIARIAHIEAEINKFNLHMGFGGAVIPKGMAQPFQR